MFLSFKKFDWPLFIVIILLICLSLIAQSSLNLGQEGQRFSTFNRQVLFAGIGLILFLVVSFFDYRALKRYIVPLYIFSVILLFLVLIFGQTLRGTRGWLVGFQVVELVKIALILVLAKYWSACRINPLGLKEILISGVITLLPIILIILQPDFGSTIILATLWLFLILLIDKRLKNFLKILAVLILILIIAWLFLLKDYQKERLLTLISPQRDPFGSGYQVNQSIISVGSGRILGRGFGLGSQSQLRFLPETKTDFVFSVVAEEFGFLGAGLILLLYFILFWRIIKIIKSTYDDFGLFLVFGVAIIFFIQIIINIGMNLGIAPIAGITLPLLSYGGSSLLISLILLGLVESVTIHRVEGLVL